MEIGLNFDTLYWTPVTVDAVGWRSPKWRKRLLVITLHTTICKLGLLFRRPPLGKLGLVTYPTCRCILWQERERFRAAGKRRSWGMEGQSKLKRLRVRDLWLSALFRFLTHLFFEIGTTSSGLSLAIDDPAGTQYAEGLDFNKCRIPARGSAIFLLWLKTV